ncbi:hypothetical protein CARUB_v10028702mg [Capsella rubella]|uniref:Transmembrane protein n=1 Tax=Capsella rubella TaxID=81985 RepID=R0GVT1_9BRAS|nr:hypothetical protein CARUB_v10028702mg [Capsella rubella]
MVKNGLLNLGIVFLFLVVILVPCSIDSVLASPQELLSATGWRRKLITLRPSVSSRTKSLGAPPSPPPPPFVPPPSAISMKRIRYF